MNRAALTAMYVWASSHDLRPRAVVTAAGCWLGSALGCYLALPRVAPSPEPLTVDLQLFGLVALAVTAGISSVNLHDRAPWLPAVSPRRLGIVRACWGATLLLGAVVLGLLSATLLPDGLPPLTGYLAVGLLWWSVAVAAAVIGGQVAGLLAPLALAMAMSTKLVPWEANLIYHPDLADARMLAAVVGPIISIALYVWFGSARDRRRR